jgi:hypothetical protein
MIFPDLPKRKNFIIEPKIQQTTIDLKPTSDEPKPAVDVEQWMIEHGWINQVTSAANTRPKNEPIDWFARDAWEFYLLCTGMLGWIVYWYGVHRGVW